MNMNKNVLKEISHQLYLEDFLKNTKFSNWHCSLANGEQHTSFFSSTVITIQEFFSENEKLNNNGTLPKTLPSSAKTTTNETKNLLLAARQKILQKNPVCDILNEKENYSQKILIKITHSCLKNKNPESVLKNENNVTDFENLKSPRKNVLDNYMQGILKTSICSIRPTKSSLFQYFTSSQLSVLDKFYSSPASYYLENDTFSEKYDSHTDHFFDALRINSNYATLIHIPTFDQKPIISPSAVFLEDSFSILDLKKGNINEQDENRMFTISSLSHNQDSKQSGATPAMSVCENSEYSDSSSETVSETEDSTDVQIYMSSCYQISSNPSSEVIFRSFQHSHPIYSTSSALECSVSSTFSSSTAFDDVF